MIPDEAMTLRHASKLIDRAVGIRISIETMKQVSASTVGAEFPLVSWDGKARIVGSDGTRLSVLVRGLRVDLAWDRVAATWTRLLSNHTLTVDELGGGADAVGLVSLFAFFEPDTLTVFDDEGMLVVDETEGTPVHQFADMSRPTSWAPWRRQIHGD